MATRANIIIDQGADFRTSIELTDDDGYAIDLSGFTGSAQMRKYYNSSRVYDFTVSFDSDNSVVLIEMSANTTNTIPSGRYVYDCEVTDSANVKTRLVEGIVTVTPGVTR